MQECRNEPGINNYQWIHFFKKNIKFIDEFLRVCLNWLEFKLESEKVNENISTNKAGSDVKKV